MKTKETLSGPAHQCDACLANSGRRDALKLLIGAAVATGVGAAPALASEDDAKKGDWLVREDDDEKKPLVISDLKAGEKQIITYPYDPVTKKVRNGSRLNRIIVIKLDRSAMDSATQQHAAGNVVAYSGVCTHQGCDVSAWLSKEQAFLCYCHFSKFAPLEGGKVVGGPAPRSLPAIPLKVDGDKLVLAGGFDAAPGRTG